ncbi:hypothetical protein DSO57_1019573 [Entomophthora muscae]|uniref:Uncharacterized protein n=1 Tax=Entomophthora muscae TaxID=34485 RepID=A0ACC2TSD9_9FUNG|nr:hypothetical protein DSO57_1019573 [Entomophthora muscae]
MLVPPSRDFPVEHLPPLVVLPPSRTPWLSAVMLVMAVNVYCHGLGVSDSFIGELFSN